MVIVKVLPLDNLHFALIFPGIQVALQNCPQSLWSLWPHGPAELPTQIGQQSLQALGMNTSRCPAHVWNPYGEDTRSHIKWASVSHTKFSARIFSFIYYHERRSGTLPRLRITLLEVGMSWYGPQLLLARGAAPWRAHRAAQPQLGNSASSSLFPSLSDTQGAHQSFSW